MLEAFGGKPQGIHEAAVLGDIDSIQYYIGKINYIDIQESIGHSPVSAQDQDQIVKA